MKRHATYYVKHPRRASLHNYRYVKKAAEKYWPTRSRKNEEKLAAVLTRTVWTGGLHREFLSWKRLLQSMGKVRVGRYSMRRREGIMWDMQWVGRHSIQCGVEKHTSINECVCGPLCARLASKSFRRDVTVSVRPSFAIRIHTSTSTRTAQWQRSITHAVVLKSKSHY